MNTCYTNDGAIQFFRGNVAKLSCNEEGGNSYAGSYGNSYGNSYGGAYGSNNGCRSDP